MIDDFYGDAESLLNAIETSLATLEASAGQLRGDAQTVSARAMRFRANIHQRQFEGGILFETVDALTGANRSATELIADGQFLVHFRYLAGLIGLDRVRDQIETAISEAMRRSGVALPMDEVAVFFERGDRVYDPNGVRLVNTDVLALAIVGKQNGADTLRLALPLATYVDRAEIVVQPFSPARLVHYAGFPFRVADVVLAKVNAALVGDELIRFPVREPVEFMDPFAEEENLTFIDVHVLDALSVVFLARPGRHARVTLTAAPAFNWDAAYIGYEVGILHAIKEIADTSLRDVIREIEGARVKGRITRLQFRDGAVSVTIHVQGCRRRYGCKGCAWGDFHFSVTPEHARGRLTFTARQLGAPTGVGAGGSPRRYCDVADWFTRWKSDARNAIRRERLPPTRIIDRPIPDVRDVRSQVSRDRIAISFLMQTRT